MAGMNVRSDVLNQIEKPKPSGRDLAYRAVAAVFGGPVDLTAMVMKPFGYGEEKPILGSEWIGQKMENVGLVSEARDPLQEFMASLLVPGGGIEAALPLAAKGVAAAGGALGGLYAMHKMAGPVDKASSLARMGEATRQSGVIKGKGGNWLTGSVEDALKPLKEQAGARGLSAEDVMAEMNAVYTPEAMSRLSPESLATVQRSMAELTPKVALNQWVEGPLTKYVKTRMASPDDEIRKLADQGVLHFDPQGGANYAKASRRRAGMPEGHTALTDMGKSWEDQADAEILATPAGDWNRDPAFASSKGRQQAQVAKDPWLATVDPSTPIYTPASVGGVDLGFRHLTDELSNALNPESGLPRALQLSPDQMKNLSVEKAVRRVADINKWRANQMAEANKALAFDEKTAPIFKEYQTVPGYGNGQPNEKGLHWREIKAPEGTNPAYLGGGKYEDPMADALKKQLKYEGDTMGHCVGGYCDAVLSGESQVYTLRDKTGKPHVTIEVKSSVDPWDENSEELLGRLRDEAYQQPHIKAAEKRLRKRINADDDAAYEEMDNLVEEWVSKEASKMKTPPRIVQIKGAKNSAPKDEYVPFIQDFIRNDNFSDVGDLANAQMKRASQTFNKTELEYLEKHGAKLTGEEYLTEKEVEALQSLFKKKDQ